MKIVQILIFLIVIIDVNSFKIRQNTLPSAFDYLSNIDPTILQSVRCIAFGLLFCRDVSGFDSISP